MSTPNVNDPTLDENGNAHDHDTIPASDPDKGS